MTSLRQIEANRRNSLKSTGPSTDNGKRQSRRNALRHGLTAETVVRSLEDAADYKAFELSITSDFDAQTAVERELVLRLASLLWRLRRAIAIESGLLQMHSEAPKEDEEVKTPEAPLPFTPLYRIVSQSEEIQNEDQSDREPGDVVGGEYNDHIARSFLRLAKEEHGAARLLGRYETALWRQVGQILFTLDALQWKAFRRHYRLSGTMRRPKDDNPFRQGLTRTNR